MNSDELEEQKKTNLLLGNLISEVVQIKFELINERLRRESPKREVPIDLGTGGQYKITVLGEE